MKYWHVRQHGYFDGASSIVNFLNLLDQNEVKPEHIKISPGPTDGRSFPAPDVYYYHDKRIGA